MACWGVLKTCVVVQSHGAMAPFAMFVIAPRKVTVVVTFAAYHVRVQEERGHIESKTRKAEHTRWKRRNRNRRWIPVSLKSEGRKTTKETGYGVKDTKSKKSQEGELRNSMEEENKKQQGMCRIKGYMLDQGHLEIYCGIQIDQAIKQGRLE